MIKTKKDLVGRYAVREDKEVFELFMQKCEEFGIKWNSGKEARQVFGGEAVYCLHGNGRVCMMWDYTYFCESENYKRLTLADFKQPKTRTEYKPVTMRDFEALQEFHAGKEFYHKPTHARNYNLVPNVETLIQAHVGGWLYTKEDVELDWRDVANGYDQYNSSFSSPNYEVSFLYEGTQKEFLRMCHEVAEMTNKPE